jgi:predicted esterase
MRGLKIPSLLRNARDNSITLAYQQVKYSLIWLHGAGDSPDSYLPYFTHLQSPLYSGCRIKLLSAPNQLRSPTANHTSVWYDNEGDLDHINTSHKYLHQCFNEEMEVWR